VQRWAIFAVLRSRRFVLRGAGGAEGQDRNRANGKTFHRQNFRPGIGIVYNDGDCCIGQSCHSLTATNRGMSK